MSNDDWDFSSLPTVDNELVSIKDVSEKKYELINIKPGFYNDEKLVYINSIWSKTDLFKISDGNYLKARSIIEKTLSKDELNDFFKLQRKLYLEFESKTEFLINEYEFILSVNAICKKFLDNKKREFIEDLI